VDSVIARSEVTKQSSLSARPLDCFAALAMTVQAEIASIVLRFQERVNSPTRHPEALAVLHGKPRRMGNKRMRQSFEARSFAAGTSDPMGRRVVKRLGLELHHHPASEDQDDESRSH
jgi:hypothetical protein